MHWLIFRGTESLLSSGAAPFFKLCYVLFMLGFMFEELAPNLPFYCCDGAASY